MTRGRTREAPQVSVTVVAVLGAIALLAGAALTGQPLLSLAALAWLCLAWLMNRASLHTNGLLLLAVALVADDPRARPYMDMWPSSPSLVPGRLLFDGVGKTFGMAGLKVFGIEMWVGLLAVMALGRVMANPARHRVPLPLVGPALLAIFGVLWLEAWGLVRGGNLPFSMLQLRPMVLTGILVIVFSMSQGTPYAPRRVMASIVVVAVVRALLGLYFWRFQMDGSAMPDLSLGGGAYITNHGDTVVWVTALSICLAYLLEQPSRRTLSLVAFVLPIVGVAIIANNRRVAPVSLVLSTAVIFLLGRAAVRRRFVVSATLCAPIALLYVAAAWNSDGLWASPILALRSALFDADTSSSMRDIESYNLIFTARQALLFGSGLGHAYIEKVQAISIADLLEAYRYLPHNSLLWLVSVGGLVGTWMYWLFVPMGAFLATRLYDRGNGTDDRVLAMASVGAIGSYGVQCFADIGMQVWPSIFVLAALLGTTSARAIRRDPGLG